MLPAENMQVVNKEQITLLNDGSGSFVHELTLIFSLDFNLIVQRSSPKEAALIKYIHIFAYVRIYAVQVRGSSKFLS